MKRIPFISLMVCIGLILFSCVKKDTSPPTTIFSLHCIDIQGNPLKGTIVGVFNSQFRWQTSTDVSYAGITDANGDISFSAVDAQMYYFWCIDTANCLINWNQNSTGNPLAANTTNTRDVVLTAYGTLSVINASPDKYSGYQVKLNGQNWWPGLAYGDTLSTTLPIGTDVVEAINQTNAAIDKKYNVTITQCQTVYQKIP